jgi:transcription elongation factor Elf1
MSEPASTAPSGPPRCPKCRSRPTVQSVVSIRSGFEYFTLRCTICGIVYDAQMHTDPMMSGAGGWIDSIDRALAPASPEGGTNMPSAANVGADDLGR